MTIFRPVQKIDANWLTPGLCSRLARLLGLLVLLAGVPALAAVYKWVDDEGEIHFSDQPRAPRSVPVEVRPTLPATPSSADRNLPAVPSNDPDEQLLQAVRVGDELAIGRALHQGANVNGRHGKQIPLFVAILHEQPKALGYLIRLGADPNHTNGRDYGALHYAAERNRPGFDSLSLLLDRGIDVNARDNRGSTALLEAVRTGHVASVQLLIAHGASLQARNGKGEQVIYIARSRAWIQLYPLLQP